MLWPRPDSRGSKLGPEPASSGRSTPPACEQLWGSPRRRLPRAFPPRPRLLRLSDADGPRPRAALAPAPGPRGAGSSCLPQGQPRRRRSVPAPTLAARASTGRGPGGAGRGTCTSSQGELGVRTTKAPCLSPGTGRATVRPGNFAGGLRSGEMQRTTGPQPFAPRPAPGSSDVHS